MIPLLALLSALWLGPDRALISWSQGSGLHCLYRQPENAQPVLVRCFNDIGSHGMYLYGGDAAYHPHAGDVYVLLRSDGTWEKAALRSVSYFPVWR